MTGFSREECIACERCGAFIPKIMAQFHRCLGSDLSKRPANIPLELWLSMQRERARIEDLFKTFRSQPLAVSLDEDEPTRMYVPSPIVDTTSRIHSLPKRPLWLYLLFALAGALFGAAVAAALLR